MHELGLVKHVIAQAEKTAEENGAERVLILTLEIGEVSSIVPSYFTDCFEWAKKKTRLMRDTELEMIILKAVSYCTKCKNTYKTTEHAKICPYCKSAETYLVTGNEMTIKDMVIE